MQYRLGALIAVLLACGVSCGQPIREPAKSCAEGNADDCYRAGREEIFDAFAKKDAKAEKNLRRLMAKACSLNQVNACAFLARVYRFGLRDRSKAIRTLRAQAEKRLEDLLASHCRAGKRNTCDILVRHFAVTDREALSSYYAAGAKGPRPASRPRTLTAPDPSFKLQLAKRVKASPQPPPAVVHAVISSGILRFYTGVALCLDEEGVPNRIRLIISSGLAIFDAYVLEEISRWRYAPFRVNDKPTPACTATGFGFVRR